MYIHIYIYLVFGQLRVDCRMAVGALGCPRGVAHRVAPWSVAPACPPSQMAETGPHAGANSDRLGGMSGTCGPSAMGAKESDSGEASGRVEAWATGAYETGVARHRMGVATSCLVPVGQTSSGEEEASGVRREEEASDRGAETVPEQMAEVCRERQKQEVNNNNYSIINCQLIY